MLFEQSLHKDQVTASVEKLCVLRRKTPSEEKKLNQIQLSIIEERPVID